MPTKPLSETLEDLAEKLLPVKLAGAAVGLEDHRRLLADHARRVEDAHRAQAAAAGMTASLSKPEADMGDIIITGDITNQPTPAAGSPPPGPVPSKLLQYGLLAAGFAAGGVAGPILAALLLRPTPAAVQPASPSPPAQEWEIKIWSVDGKRQESIRPVEPGK